MMLFTLHQSISKKVVLCCQSGPFIRLMYGYTLEMIHGLLSESLLIESTLPYK